MPAGGDRHEVTTTEDRLRVLLEANRSIISDLELPTVLRHVAEAARQLVGARYAALGVLAPDGTGLEQFVHTGLDDDTVARIGDLPQGRGLLGALIDDPRPIRLRDLREDPRSSGFPAHHPAMRSFLGVPLRVRGDVFGNLYLADAPTGEFSDEDEHLVAALAATAGIAVDNARLYEEARHRQDWLTASTEVTRRLLAGSDEGELDLIAESVQRLADADIVTLVRPDLDRGLLLVEVAAGPQAHWVTDSSYPLAGTLTEEVLMTGSPALVEDATHPGGAAVQLAERVPVGPVMVVPLAGSAGVRGTLVVGRLQGRRRFSDADLDMAATFASHASMALELGEARRDHQRYLVLEDRARIARDLHDHVIQQLFAVGMTLQGVTATLPEAPALRLVEGAVDKIDDAIRQIRTSIFQLRPPPVHAQGLRAMVLEVTGTASRALGFDPFVTFEGPVDAVSDTDLASDVAAVVRELVTNAARHASATRVEVRVSAHDNVMELRVADDGVGMPPHPTLSGLDNLSARAAARGGALVVEESTSMRGAAVRWEVPL